MFKIPYALLPEPALQKNSSFFIGLGAALEKSFPFLKLALKQAETDYSPREYLSMCLMASTIFFFFFLSFLTFVLLILDVDNFFLMALMAATAITMFAFFQQISYPKIHANRRLRDIERNLLSALQNILIQLNSGVPLFETMVNVSKEDYGEISKEFSKAVKAINGGKDQIEALEDMAAINPSLFFRRAIWQLVNGMKSGANMTTVIQEIIDLLAEEQILQIQRYGSQLNPLAMFYMLVVVIAPSLGMTFMLVLSSFISLPEVMTKMMFWGVYALVTFFQIMFMGIIKSKRPNLLQSD